MKSFCGSALNFLTTFITTVVVIVALALVVVKVTDGNLFVIESDSMAPLYPKNSLVVVYSADFDDIETDDVITYVLNEQGTLVTHRVVATDDDAQSFTTQGDANAIADSSPVAYENVVGKVYLVIPFLGRVVSFVQNNKLASIITVGALLLFSFFYDLIRSLIKKKKAKEEKENQLVCS